MVGPNLLTIDERKDQAIREKRPEFLHQVQRQSRPPRTIDVQKTDARIEPGAGAPRRAIGQQQAINERQKRIDGIERRPTIPARYRKGLTLLPNEGRNASK